MRNIIILFVLLLSLQTQAQTIYPIPQSMEVKGKIPFVGIKSTNPVLKSYFANKGIGYKETKKKGLSKEEYTLTISSKQITIAFASERGRFYALKTLEQLLQQAKKEGTLPLLTITDRPDIAFRGTVEGFYGKPWSHEDRISQLRFYGDWKLNTYIYGPKDDPFHSSPKWRVAYPDAESIKLKELVQIAKANHVDFYWAIHPGLDIKWTLADSTAVLHKFELMYELGIRHFAVFFDDISGEGTKAEKQAGLLNYLQKEFVDRKKDVGPLIMCPTEYNKGWSNKKEGTYLDILGNELDQRIHVMWTGNTVIHDITLEGQEWVNKRIKRPSFVWWNFPVSDYVRNHLLLGESYGLDKDAKNEMSGFVSNPMDKPEASKVAIFSIANYAWNLKNYDSKKTWSDAFNIIHPEIEGSYRFFSGHNTDPGPSYHQYRRVESENISEILDSRTKSLEEDVLLGFNAQESALLKQVFTQFQTSSQDILTNSKNSNLITEIKPWLTYYKVQGAAGLLLLEMNDTKNKDVLYRLFQQFQKEKDKMFEIDQTENRNPYQPGIVTASRHVLPWIEQSYLYYHKMLKSSGYAVKEAANQPVGAMYTNIENLKSMPVQNAVVTGNRPLQVLRIGRTLEYIPFKPKDYIGVEVKSNSKIKEVKFKFEEKVEGLQVEYSENGLEWKKDKIVTAKFIRLINVSNELKTGKLHVFEVIFE